MVYYKVKMVLKMMIFRKTTRSGGDKETRTPDPLLAKQMLYQLSYAPIWSGRRESNPRPQPWQGCALPLSYARSLDITR